MRRIFTSTLYFTLFFLIILGLDIYVKLSLDPFPYRYITKPLVMLCLLGFYLTHQRESSKRKLMYVVLGICSFMIGDLFLINHLNTLSVITGMTFFMIGKILYSLKFSHVTDINLKRLVPFLFVVFAFISVLFSLIYDKLGDLFMPVLFYFFVSLLTLQIAYLRKGAVNFKSYMLVLIGIEFLVVGESILALKMFYANIPYQDLLTMLIYGVSQYFIIIGLLKETSSVHSLDNNALKP